MVPRPSSHEEMKWLSSFITHLGSLFRNDALDFEIKQHRSDWQRTLYFAIYINMFKKNDQITGGRFMYYAIKCVSCFSYIFYNPKLNLNGMKLYSKY